MKRTQFTYRKIILSSIFIFLAVGLFSGAIGQNNTGGIKDQLEQIPFFKEIIGIIGWMIVAAIVALLLRRPIRRGITSGTSKGISNAFAQETTAIVTRLKNIEKSFETLAEAMKEASKHITGKAIEVKITGGPFPVEALSEAVVEETGYRTEFERAITLRKEENYTEATNILRDIIKENPTDVEVLLELGRVYFVTGQSEEAINIFLNIIDELEASRQQLAEAFYRLGRVYESYDSPDRYLDAIFYFEMALDHDHPRSDEIYSIQGYSYWRTENLKQAIDKTEKGLRLAEMGDNHHLINKLRQNLAYYYSETGNNKLLNKAENLCITIDDERPWEETSEMYSKFLDTWGYVNMEMGNYENAKKLFEQSANIYSRPLVYMHLAEVLERMERQEKPGST